MGNKPLYQIPSLQKEYQSVAAQISEVVDSRVLAIQFRTLEEREEWRKLAERLGHDEHAMARHILTNFIKHCEVPQYCSMCGSKHDGDCANYAQAVS